MVDDVGDGTSLVPGADLVANFDFQNGPARTVLGRNSVISLAPATPCSERVATRAGRLWEPKARTGGTGLVCLDSRPLLWRVSGVQDAPRSESRALAAPKHCQSE